MKDFVKKINLKILLPALFLTAIGLVSILSFCVKEKNFLLFRKQLVFWAISITLFIGISFLDLRFLRKNSTLAFLLYCFILLLLGGVLVFGEEVRGVKGWYKIGPFSLDPVPLAAIVLIIVLSKYFALRHVYLKTFKPLAASALYLLPPFFLVFFQPDLGSSFLLFFVWLGIVFFSGIKPTHLLTIFLIILILFSLGWQFWLKDYQKQRILSFLRGGDPQGISWNAIQSKIAIGSGGFWGKGFGKGSQFHYGFLPEPLTDFIFSTISEEFGFWGDALLISLFCFLFWQIMKVALSASDNFTRLFASGFAFLLLGQSFVNIGMALGILPVVGIPLPFVSYGGSHLLGFYLGLAILSSLKNTL